MLNILTPLIKSVRVSRKVYLTDFMAAPGMWVTIDNDGAAHTITTGSNVLVAKLCIKSYLGTLYEENDVKVGRITTLERYDCRFEVDSDGYSGDVFAQGDYLCVDSSAGSEGKLKLATVGSTIVAYVEGFDSETGILTFVNTSPSIMPSLNYYYCDLSLGTNGHTGTSIDPFSFNDLNTHSHNNPQGNTYYITGTAAGSGELWIMSNTWTNWSAHFLGPWTIHDPPWSVVCLDGANVSNCIISNSTGGFTPDGGTFNNCYFNTLNGVAPKGAIAFNGCTINKLVDSNYPLESTTFTDCLIGSITGSVNTSAWIFNNCAIAHALASHYTYHSCQNNWTAPSFPDYDDPQSAFYAAILAAGVTTPPQPGHGYPTYPGYSTDLWGNHRTGIGSSYQAVTPVASFTYVVDENTNLVTFTDTSTNFPTSWLWDFGDYVGTSTEQNPTYTYSEALVYIVSLISTNDAGSSEPFTDTVNVHYAPTTTQEPTTTTTTTTTYGPTTTSTTSTTSAPPDYTYTLSEGNATITGYNGASTDISIPSSIDGYPVVALATHSFWYSGLTSVIIPNSITSLGNGTFEGCTQLISVTLPNNITILGLGIFNSCSLLNNVIIPESVTDIQSAAFRNCASLASIIIPASVTNIFNSVFMDCSVLISATFNGNAPGMDTNVFTNAAMGFKVYFYHGATGFTTPTWPIGNGDYPTEEIIVTTTTTTTTSTTPVPTTTTTTTTTQVPTTTTTTTTTTPVPTTTTTTTPGP
jgi:PKD repeat protein